MDENKKLSQYSVSQLTAIQDQKDGYIPAFIDNKDNYKVKASDFVAKTELVDAVGGATYMVRYAANSSINGNLKNRAGLMHGWKICTTEVDRSDGGHDTAWVEFIISINQWTTPVPSKRLNAFCRISQRWEGDTGKQYMVRKASINMFSGKVGFWKLVGIVDNNTKYTDWYIYSDYYTKFSDEVTQNEYKMGYMDMYIQVLNQHGTNERTQIKFNDYFKKGKLVTDYKAAQRDKLTIDTTKDFVEEARVAPWLDTTSFTDKRPSCSNFYTLNKDTNQIVDSNTLTLATTGDITYSANDKTNNWSDNVNPKIVFANSTNNQSAAFVFSDYDATTKYGKDTLGCGSVLLTGRDTGGNRTDENRGAWFFKSYGVSAKKMLVTEPISGSIISAETVKWSMSDNKTARPIGYANSDNKSDWENNKNFYNHIKYNKNFMFNPETETIQVKNVSANTISATGNIVHINNTKSISHNAIQFIDNTVDQYGDAMLIGTNGLTIVGAGEAHNTYYNGAGKKQGDEQLVLASDTQIIFATNLDKNSGGYSKGKFVTIGTDGNITGDKFVGTATTAELAYTAKNIRDYKNGSTKAIGVSWDNDTLKNPTYLAGWDAKGDFIGKVDRTKLKVGGASTADEATYATGAGTATNADKGKKSDGNYANFGALAFENSVAAKVGWVAIRENNEYYLGFSADGKMGYNGAFTYNPFSKRLTIGQIRINDSGFMLNDNKNNWYTFLSTNGNTPALAGDKYKFGGSAYKAGTATKAEALTDGAGEERRPCYIDSNGKAQVCDFWVI